MKCVDVLESSGNACRDSKKKTIKLATRNNAISLITVSVRVDGGREGGGWTNDVQHQEPRRERKLCVCAATLDG